MTKNNETARRHLDVKFNKIRDLNLFTRPPKGWIRAIRNALGMTTTQLAKKLNIAQPRVTAIEKDEVLGNLKISTLESVADALGCELVYTLVPRENLEKMTYKQAEKKAKLILKNAEHTMKMENQLSSSDSYKKQLEDLINELIKGQQARLWDEE